MPPFSSAIQSQIPILLDDHASPDMDHLFPKGKLDVNQQQLDLRDSNSWILQLGQISTSEMMEVLAINTLAPFIMNNKLIPRMKAKYAHKEKKGPQFIINVSAMEGKFYRFKSPNHPHTNSTYFSLHIHILFRYSCFFLV